MLSRGFKRGKAYNVGTPSEKAALRTLFRRFRQVMMSCVMSQVKDVRPSFPALNVCDVTLMSLMSLMSVFRSPDGSRVTHGILGIEAMEAIGVAWFCLHLCLSNAQHL